MKDYKSSGEAGVIKQHSEEKVAMLKSGGGKYSYNNPKELTEKEAKLSKVLNK
jgi:FMN-dependent NADH-azoreductase